MPYSRSRGLASLQRSYSGSSGQARYAFQSGPIGFVPVHLVGTPYGLCPTFGCLRANISSWYEWLFLYCCMSGQSLLALVEILPSLFVPLSFGGQVLLQHPPYLRLCQEICPLLMISDIVGKLLH